MTLAKSLQSAAGNAAGEANYIESVFQTWLYTGNGSTQTITNGIDLAGEGGLVWFKDRSSTGWNTLVDTVRGAGKAVFSNSTEAEDTSTNYISAFTSSGFSLSGSASNTNTSGRNYASWTFRKQPKFFDVVTWTGDGTGTGRQISHSLGSAPGCIILKSTSTAGTNWIVYHRSLATNFTLKLQTTDAAVSNAWISTVTDTYFTGSGSAMNVSGQTYVAYLFAHDAGGFGLSGEDNVISCGSYTGSASDVAVTLGYEAQWVLVKNTTTAANWQMLDIMRGMPLTGTAPTLAPNLSNAESNQTAPVIVPTATGFRVTGGLGFALNYEGDNYIYIAIRRGPMQVPESGTSVFAPVLRVNDNTSTTSNFPVDLAIESFPSLTSSSQHLTFDRLRGNNTLKTQSTAAETVGTISANVFQSNTSLNATNYIGFATSTIFWMFGRAPGFFDEVCYTGTGSARTVAHNLAAVPELMIVKNRVDVDEHWQAYHAALGATHPIILSLGNAAYDSATEWNDTEPTSTVFTVGTQKRTNFSGSTYVAYLFATLAGVSKVGSYTGTGATQQINCGFTSGARFVLIKRTDSTGDWYVWDSARGIVAGNDSYLLLNSTAAEVTSTDYIDTYSAGFEISSTAPAAINASGGTFLFLAVA